MSNAYIHSEISVKRRKGCIEDYYSLHDFIDCTKELESSNKHRIFHNLWGIKQIIIPIFGHTIINSDGIKVNVKDMMESDHVLADYQNRWLPTLNDFVEAIEDDKNDENLINEFYKVNKSFLEKNSDINSLLLSPRFITGKPKSLLITCNSWFLGFILPKIFPKIDIKLDDLNISPSIFFNRMNFQDWMQNGNKGCPPSCAKIEENRKKKVQNPIPHLQNLDLPLSDIVVDGSRHLLEEKEIKPPKFPSLEEQEKNVPKISKGFVYYDGSFKEKMLD